MAIGNQVRAFSVTAAVVAGMAAIGACGLKQKLGQAKIPKTPTTKIESPILASGGSLTFRSPYGWTCTPTAAGAMTFSYCYTGQSITKIVFSAHYLFRPDSTSISGYTPAPDNSNNPLSTGAVSFMLRQPNADAGSQPPQATSPVPPYVELCTSKYQSLDNNCGTSSGYFQVQVHNSGSSNAVLICSNGVEVLGFACPPTSTGPIYAVQYFDPTCHVHGTTNSGGSTDKPPPYVPACEHPGWVQWPVDNYYYSCRSGSCWVTLDTAAY